MNRIDIEGCAIRLRELKSLASAISHEVECSNVEDALNLSYCLEDLLEIRLHELETSLRKK